MLAYIRSVHVFALIGSLLLLIGHNQLSKANAATFDFATDPSMSVGAGFDTIRLQVLGDCVERTPLEAPEGASGQNTTFALQQIESYDSLIKGLSLSASASVKAAIGSVEGRTTMARSISINNYSLYALASVLVENAPKRMRDVKLNENARNVLSSGGPDALRTMCGDEFVVGLITGGEFRAIIEISTRSEEEKANISASLSGSYKLFSGEAQFQETLQKITSTNKIQVYTYQSGGVGQTIAIEPKKMIENAVNFPNLVKGEQARPIAALTQNYRTLPLPPGPSPLDVAAQHEVINFLASLTNNYMKNINNISYILGYSREFKSPDIEGLSNAMNIYSENLNKIRSAASKCYSDLKKCDIPTNLVGVNINLPERHRKIEDYCNKPVFIKKTDPLCGPQRFNQGRGEVCGVELYNEGRGNVCGVERYNVAAGPACGVESYAEGRGAVCGRDKILLVEFGWFPKRISCLDFNGGDVFDEDSETCYVYRTCRDESFGVTFKSCEHESFGVASYAVCRDKAFGAEKYKLCENGAFGIAEYASCERPEFGFLRCGD